MDELAHALASELTEHYDEQYTASYHPSEDCRLGFSKVDHRALALIVWDNRRDAPWAQGEVESIHHILTVIFLNQDGAVIKEAQEDAQPPGQRILLQVDYCHPDFIDLIIATLDGLIEARRAVG